MRLIGLDVGTKRIGVAKADTTTRIAIPDGYINVNGQEFSEIARIARLNDTTSFVIGLPRSNEGNETAQSAYVRKFAHTLAQNIPGTRIYFQDESLTSVEAEKRLKARKSSYTRGDIDAESAAIILQDCIEHFSARTNQHQSPKPKADIGEIWAGAKQKAHATAQKASTSRPKAGKIVAAVVIVLIILLGSGFVLANHWYQDQLRAVEPSLTCEQPAEGTELPSGCQPVKFTVSEAESLVDISKNLENQKLIRSALAFQLYAKLNNLGSSLKAGEYNLRETMSTPEIIDALEGGRSIDNVFSLTILPGQNLADLKATLISNGYDSAQIDSAFTKDYSTVSPTLRNLLSTKPPEVSIEGYLYAETYEFYKNESVENIIIRTMEQLATVVEANNLVAVFQRHDLTLHEGLTLASIVQREAAPSDQAGVARVFFNRLHQGIVLGSDVTAQYAADLVDPERQTYTDNAAILELDSPYNTRKYAGLPPGPICSPSLSALKAVAEPADSDYLYFLTGDDGVVYYSYTEEEHLNNVSAHCQELCNTQL